MRELWDCFPSAVGATLSETFNLRDLPGVEQHVLPTQWGADVRDWFIRRQPFLEFQRFCSALLSWLYIQLPAE